MRTNRILLSVGALFLCGNLAVGELSAQVADSSKTTEKTETTTGEAAVSETGNDGVSVSTLKEIKAIESNQVVYDNRGDDRYRIGFQDTLDIQVYRHPELSQTLSVNPDGTIRLFRIDNPVTAVCKTERELAYTIETLYKNYLRTPQVNVRAVEQRSQPFAVMGAVEKPGSFFLNKKVRLIQLLSLAGGFDVENAGMKVQVARIGNLAGCTESQDPALDEDAKIEFLSFNLDDILEGRENPWMEPGDVVTVKRADEIYVVGDVVEPSKIELRGPTSLTRAIAMAKGFEKNAQTDKVTIERQNSDSPVKTELVYSLKDIRDKKIPDPLLQPNDIVIVATNRTKAVTNSLIKALTGGLGNLFYRFPL
ncbi:MAG: polysaccharide biosynthesis/export family protein [Pyrinomonadaceae bacterium]|nr:polysaccharide biosynthesis/export family protein [Pyrinomonadaceae bacterium]